MIALDLGSSSLKRSDTEGRTPTALAGAPPGGEMRLALVGQDEAQRRALLESGLEQVEIVPAPIALALAAPFPPEERAAWAVIDAGHAALRVHLVRWHRLGERLLPRVEKTLLEDPLLGGAALDRSLAKEAWSAASLPPADELVARGFFEVKELASQARGGLARPVGLPGGTAAVEVPAHAVKAAFARLVARARAVAPELARVTKDASRAIAGGGLIELAPFRAVLAKALGEKLVVLEKPLLGAARGALRALEQPIVPRAASAISLLARKGNGVAAIPLVSPGALLPGRFGPVRVEVAVASDPLELIFLDGDSVKRALLSRRKLEKIELAWSWEAGWTVHAGDGQAALSAADPAKARAARDALAFDFSKHAERASLDVAFVFVATKGEGPLLARAVEAMTSLARRAAERGARVGAIATGDHPQGGVRPRYVTLAHPLGDLASLERFLGEQAKDPVDGVDAPEALECALAKAAEMGWRADAERVLYVLTDVPPHEKNEPPFCSTDWREAAKRLRAAGVAIFPVLLEGGALAPDLAKKTRAFLEGLRGAGEAPLSVRGKASEALLATVDRSAGKMRLDAAGREVLGRISVAAV